MWLLLPLKVRHGLPARQLRMIVALDAVPFNLVILLRTILPLVSFMGQ